MSWAFVLATTAGAALNDLQGAKNRAVTFTLSDAPTCTFSLDGRDPDASAIAELETDLLVYRGGVLMHRGRLASSGDELDENSHTASFAAPGYRALLGRRFLDSYEAGKASQIPSSNNQLVDSSKIWTTNSWAGKAVRITGGTGSDGNTSGPQVRTISSNSATTLNILSSWQSAPFTPKGTVDNGDSTYVIEDPALHYRSLTDQSLIAWDLITAIQARTNGNLGITRGVHSGTMTTRIKSFDPGKPISECIDALAGLDLGFDWEVDEALAFNCWAYGAGLTLGRGGAKAFPLDYGGTVAKVSRTFQTDTYANVIRALGSDVSLPPYNANAGTVATDPAGVLQTEYNASDVTDYAALQAAGARQLALLNQPLPAYTVHLTPGVWRSKADFWLGDVLTLYVRSGRLNVSAPMRVVGVGFTIGDDGSEDVTVTLGQLPVTIPRRLADLTTRLAQLERR